MLSNIVGKRNRFGGWDIPPKPMKSADRSDLLRRVAVGSEVVAVRLIPSKDNVLEGEAKIVAGDVQNQVKAEGKIRVVVDRVHDPVERRYKSRFVEFVEGETKLVPLGVACIVLQIEPYCFLFEEVTDGDSKKEKPVDLQSLIDRLNVLEKQNNEYAELIKATQKPVKEDTKTK